MKRKYVFCLTLLFFIGTLHSGFGQFRIKGRVISDSGLQPLNKAVVKTIDGKYSSSSDSLGVFTLSIGQFPITLEITHIGFENDYFELNSNPNGLLEIRLKESVRQLEEVIVSTGYQQIPKERMTGSFVQVDNQLFNRRVSTDVLSRLEDIVPGLVFNRDMRTTNISIRGRNTISGDGQPLIVVDNFPFEGDLSSLNPNDIENVSVLKDAAASSIWGARAGNGVIVITTKKGGYLQEPRVTFNTNLTIAQKPNLYYQPTMAIEDYIDWEQSLFERGYYNGFVNSPNRVAFTPVVELLFQQRDGQISQNEASNRINALKSYDIRRDYERFLFRNTTNQQYALSLNGGSAKQGYAVSLGYDKNLSSIVGNDNERITINANHSYRLVNNKLEFSTGIFYGSQLQHRNSIDLLTYTGTASGATPIYPYARIVDENNTPISIEKKHRNSFAMSALENGLLNWTFNPLEELGFSDKSTRNEELRLRTGLNYKILPSLKAEVSYIYQSSTSNLRDYYSPDTYFARDIINTYTQVDGNGNKTLAVPAGGILDRASSTISGHSLRGQLNFSKKIGLGDLDIIAGSEIRGHNTEIINNRWYGYDDEYATSLPVDYVTGFKSYVNPDASAIRIPFNEGQSYQIDRYLSYYTNGAYRLKNKYIISGSGRLDQSNLFGVKANQKGVPLWSSGLAWIISSEDFIKNSSWSYLKLRLTYGSSGNVNKSLSSETTAIFSSFDNLSQRPYATIQNPPNPHLQWEKVKMLNLGLDFEHESGRFGGSIEYYYKRGLNLFGQVPYAPSTGITTFRGNTSSTKGQGIDVSLNFKVIKSPISWSINSLNSYVYDKITDFKMKFPVSTFFVSGGGGGYVVEGKPQFAVFSYDFAGLDKQNGDPLGYLNGEISNDWAKIQLVEDIESLRFHGSSRPLAFGSLRNNISWRQLTVSANISYRLGYYFRRQSVNYLQLLQGVQVHGDYENRWQKPGDELVTNVPSIPELQNSNRNFFYMNSSVLVEKGDHIRLQDIQISYGIPSNKFRGFKSGGIDIYVYANNLGLLWTASKTGLDPDSPISEYPAQRSISMGVKFKL